MRIERLRDNELKINYLSTRIPWGGGGGGGVVCESSDVRKFLKKSKFENFSELFKVKTRNYNISIFQYEGIHI